MHKYIQVGGFEHRTPQKNINKERSLSLQIFYLYIIFVKMSRSYSILNLKIPPIYISVSYHTHSRIQSS